MSDKTSISWADATWNPLRGTTGLWTCQKVSPGCQNCYAETFGRRFGGLPYRAGADTPRLDAGVLSQPLRWRRPREIFACSMTDLFWGQHSFEWIAAVFGVMAATPQHRYLVLTKRAARMREFFAWMDSIVSAKVTVSERDSWLADLRTHEVLVAAGLILEERPTYPKGAGPYAPWPLPNVALGVSAEDQERLDERVPHLLATPAALRFVSAEPLLGPLWFDAIPIGEVTGSRGAKADVLGGSAHFPDSPAQSIPNGSCRSLDHVIVGGESGPGARPCDVAWIRSVVRQCREADVSCHVKQLGGRPFFGDEGAGMAFDFASGKNARWTADERTPEGLTCWHFHDRKGSDPAEWPADLAAARDPWPWPSEVQP